MQPLLLLQTWKQVELQCQTKHWIRLFMLDREAIVLLMMHHDRCNRDICIYYSVYCIPKVMLAVYWKCEEMSWPLLYSQFWLFSAMLGFWKCLKEWEIELVTQKISLGSFTLVYRLFSEGVGILHKVSCWKGYGD